jgi:hypothetical protein
LFFDSIQDYERKNRISVSLGPASEDIPDPSPHTKRSVAGALQAHEIFLEFLLEST